LEEPRLLGCRRRAHSRAGHGSRRRKLPAQPMFWHSRPPNPGGSEVILGGAGRRPRSTAMRGAGRREHGAGHNRRRRRWEHPPGESSQGAHRRDPAGARRWDLPEARRQELEGGSPGRAGGSLQGAPTGPCRGRRREHAEARRGGGVGARPPAEEKARGCQREVGARPAVEWSGEWTGEGGGCR
jgi:hypothetical protein